LKRGVSIRNSDYSWDFCVRLEKIPDDDDEDDDED